VSKEEKATQSREHVLEQVAETIRSVTGAERSAVVLGEQENTAIHFVAAAGPFSDRLVGARGPAEGSGLCGNVLEGRCSILSKRTVGDLRVRQDHATEMGISTALGAPVVHEGRPFAVLMALNRVDGQSFGEDDEAALNAYAEEVASTLWQLAAARAGLGGATGHTAPLK
jgi:GAF domain-containing protein